MSDLKARIEELIEARIEELIEARQESMRNMSPEVLKAADAAYEAIVEAVVPIFVDDEKEVVDLTAMGGARVASTFFADLLKILSTGTEQEVKDLFG